MGSFAYSERKLSVTGAEPQMHAQDAALVARIRSGDQDAMTELYDRHSCLVYSVALRVLGDTGAAEDILQDVFLQLWRNPGAFNSARGKLAPWLAVIARHKAIDHVRGRRETTDIEDIVLSVDAHLEDAADRERAATKIRAALAAMPAEQRKALEMAFFQGLTHTEIAQQTGDPLGTVKTRIRSGLIQLRKVFEQ
jgi:RNA polymerase sigma-70 factor (ECF subfamily)